MTSSKRPTPGSTGDDPYHELLRIQGGRCAICRTLPKDGKRFNRDHDHVSGFLRGLLCVRCNRYVVGRHRDGDLLIAAGMYLKNPPAGPLNILLGKGPLKPKRRKRARRNP